jgi:hypothetical protein
MLLYSVKVSKRERDLILGMRSLKFGEMFGVEVPDEPYTEDLKVTGNEQDLLTLLRNGLMYIDVLTIHNGEPTLVETDLICNGFRSRKKHKLPTV